MRAPGTFAKSRTIADAAVFAAPGVFVVLWSSGFVFAKLGLAYAEPLTFLVVRMAGVLIALGLIMVLTRPKWPSGAGVLHSALTGLLVHGCYLAGVFVAIENGLSAGLAALIVSLQPVLTSTLANRWLGERVASRQWLGLALGLAGVYLVVYERTTAGASSPLAWAAITVALIGITVGTLYQKRFGAGMDWRPALFIQYLAAIVLFGVGALAFETRGVRWTPEFMLAVLYLVIVLSLGAVWLYYFMIRRAAATRVVSLFYLTPAVTALIAWAMFGERLAPLAIAGMALCVGGVFLVNWRPRGAAA
jgi:drug/metabolite transporter (DMT)-like permease